MSCVAVSQDTLGSPTGGDVISLQEHNPSSDFIGFGCVLKHSEFPTVWSAIASFPSLVLVWLPKGLALFSGCYCLTVTIQSFCFLSLYLPPLPKSFNWALPVVQREKNVYSNWILITPLPTHSFFCSNSLFKGEKSLKYFARPIFILTHWMNFLCSYTPWLPTSRVQGGQGWGADVQGGAHVPECGGSANIFPSAETENYNWETAHGECG